MCLLTSMLKKEWNGYLKEWTLRLKFRLEATLQFSS